MVREERYDVAEMGPDEKIYLVEILSTSLEDAINLVKVYEIDVIQQTAKVENGRFSVESFLTPDQIKNLQDNNYQVEIILDLDDLVNETQDWVSDDDEELPIV